MCGMSPAPGRLSSRRWKNATAFLPGVTFLILTSSLGAAPAWDVNARLSKSTVTRPSTKDSEKEDSTPRTSVTGGPAPVSDVVMVVLMPNSVAEPVTRPSGVVIGITIGCHVIDVCTAVGADVGVGGAVLPAP